MCKMKLLVMGLLGISLIGCVSQPIEIKNLNPSTNISIALPQDTSLLVYVRQPYLDKKDTDVYDKRNFIDKAASYQFLKKSSLDVARKYFKDAQLYNPGRKGQLVIFFESSFGTERFLGSLTAYVKGKVYDINGEFLYENEASSTEVTGGPLNNASLHNALVKAQMEFYNGMFVKLGSLSKHLPAGKPRIALKFGEKFKEKELREISTATGFFIDNKGHMLTNYHAVENCLLLKSYIGKKEVPVKVVAYDKDTDIALLKSNKKNRNYARFLSANSKPRLGEDIIVIGYPLQGVLTSKPSLSTGNISALAGVNDDENVYQFTAPIQPGNSGGPLLSRAGGVVGVVQSKLNAMKIASHTGDISQNVNFAIKSNKVSEFLKQNKIKYRTRSAGKRMATPDIADMATKFTSKISCVGYVEVIE